VLAQLDADLVIHSHAHHGAADGRTMGGVPVHNVSLPLLQAGESKPAFRVLEI
jgi:hypothetical protein